MVFFVKLPISRSPPSPPQCVNVILHRRALAATSQRLNLLLLLQQTLLVIIYAPKGLARVQPPSQPLVRAYYFTFSLFLDCDGCFFAIEVVERAEGVFAIILIFIIRRVCLSRL